MTNKPDFKLEYSYWPEYRIKNYYLTKRFLFWYLPIKIIYYKTINPKNQNTSESNIYKIQYNQMDIKDCIRFVNTGKIMYFHSGKPDWYLYEKYMKLTNLKTFTFNTAKELKSEFLEEFI